MQLFKALPQEQNKRRAAASTRRAKNHSAAPQTAPVPMGGHQPQDSHHCWGTPGMALPRSSPVPSSPHSPVWQSRCGSLCPAGALHLLDASAGTTGPKGSPTLCAPPGQVPQVPPPRTPARSALPVPPSPWRELKPKGRKGPARSPRPTSRQHKLLDFTQQKKQRQDRKPPSPGSRARPLPARPRSPQAPSPPSGCPGGAQAPTALTSILTQSFKQPHITQPPARPPQEGRPPPGQAHPCGMQAAPEGRAAGKTPPHPHRCAACPTPASRLTSTGGISSAGALLRT